VDSYVDRSSTWFATAAGILGFGFTFLLQDTYVGLRPFAWPMFFVGTLCLGVAAQIWFGRPKHDAASVGDATSVLLPSAMPAEPEPNIVPAGEHSAGVVFIDHTKHIRVGYGTRFDDQYVAAIVSFSNDLTRARRVGDAFDVKAEVRFVATATTKDFKVAGYWLDVLEDEDDGIRITVGSAARSLIVAVRDQREGILYAVENPSRDGYGVPPALIPLWGTALEPQSFSLQILLASDGDVLAQYRYTLHTDAEKLELRRV
jgi:hypothetical protein